MKQENAFSIKKLWKQRYLHFMIFPVIIWLIVFHYVPIFGAQIAFRDFMIRGGIFASPWAGLKYFREIVNDFRIMETMYNTIGMSLVKVVIAFPFPVLLAISINEVLSTRFKRTVQTISYLPHFISWSVVAVMATVWFSPSTGFVNDFLMKVGILREPYLFLGEAKAFWWVSLFLEVWKSTGWGSIIYLSAIAGIDAEMYEAAVIDGATRMERIWYITLPAIAGTISIMAIMNIGNMLNGGLNASNFQVSYLLGNTLNNPRSEILDTYVLKVGISMGRFSYATAVGLLKGVLSMILLLFANFWSKKFGGEQLI